MVCFGWTLNGLLIAAAQGILWAGGSGLNTAVVINQASSNSIVLGKYYCERRQVPPQNVLRIEWGGGNVSWTLSRFQETLATPLATMLTNRALSHQVDTVVLSMDIPYRVTSSNGVNSSTAALFYGFKPDVTPPPGLPRSCSLPPDGAKDYAFSEQAFRELQPERKHLWAGGAGRQPHLLRW